MASKKKKQFREEATEDPLRVEFWRMYYDDYDEAYRATVENPPWFDAIWLATFPDPEEFKRIIYDQNSLQIPNI